MKQKLPIEKVKTVFLNLLSDIGTERNGTVNREKVLLYARYLTQDDYDNSRRSVLKEGTLMKAKEMVEKVIRPFKDHFDLTKNQGGNRVESQATYSIKLVEVPSTFRPIFKIQSLTTTTTTRPKFFLNR